MSENLKKQFVYGMLWRLLEQFGSLGVAFFISLVMARLLGPSDYGTVALLDIFITISNTLVQCGFGTALIQKKDVSESDFDSVFMISVVISLLLYVTMFFSAPWIADFYHKPILIPLTRVLSLTLILNAINGVQDAVLARNMWFHLSFRISIFVSIVSGITGITLAYMGFGCWALVWSQLISMSSSTILRWFLIGWRPKFNFSLDSSKRLFSFSWKLLASNLLDTGFNNIYGLVIGRVYSSVDLGLFDKGRKFPNLVMRAINSALLSVSFPTLSRIQDEPMRLQSTMRKMIQCSTFVVMPAMAILAVIAKPLILILLGDKWLGVVPFLQISCFGFAFWPFHSINLQAINVIGRSDVFLVLEIIKKVFLVLIILLSYNKGAVVFALLSTLIGTLSSIVVNAWPNRKLLGYSVEMQLWDILPNILVSIVASCGAFILQFLITNKWLLILSQSLVFSLILFVISLAFKVSAAMEYRNLLMSVWRNFKLAKMDV